jgi:hypothetical protein
MSLEINPSNASPAESAPAAVPEASATPAPASTPAPEATNTGAEATAPAAAPASAYTPNYKFKALGEEHEIDEEYRGYIKSPDDEKRFTRVFEQIKGVGKLKENWKTAETQAKEYKQKYDHFEQSLRAIDQVAKSGNPFQALQYLGFDQDTILKAAKQALDFNDLPEHAKQIHHQNQQGQQYTQQLLAQYQQTESRAQQLEVRILKTELENTLASPEVKDVLQKYEALNGPGSFRQEVIDEANAETARTGNILSAGEAATRVLRRYKPFLAASLATSPQAQAPAAPKELPVIPTNTGAGGGSPVAKSFTSLEDIKNHRKQTYGY